MSNESPRYEPMTEADRTLARLLVRVTYAPGSPDKRFARTMAARAEESEAMVTAGQREYLHRLAQRYRRQLGKEASSVNIE